MRVFVVQLPNKRFFCLEKPSHPHLEQVVLSSHAFVRQTKSPAYYEFLKYCDKYLIKYDKNYINEKQVTKTLFYKYVRINTTIYTKVPLFFPFFCHFKPITVDDKRRIPFQIKQLF